MNNNGVVASTDLIWIQSAFDFLMGVFDRVGMWTNVRKTVGMVGRPCQAGGVRSDKSYTQIMTGERGGVKERQREQQRKWQRQQQRQRQWL